MNPYVTTGATKGLNTVQQNIGAGLERRRQIQVEAENRNMQRQKFDVGMEQANQQIELMGMQIDKLNRERAKEATFNAMDAFERTRDTKYLNMAAKDNEYVAKLFKDNGTVGFKNLQDYSPDKLLSMGYRSDMDTDANRLVVKINADGSEEIIDMMGVYAANGYIDRLDKKTLDSIGIAGASNKLKESQYAGEQASVMSEALATGDATQTMEALRLAHPEKFIATTGKNGKMDSVHQLIYANQLAAMSLEELSTETGITDINQLLKLQTQMGDFSTRASTSAGEAAGDKSMREFNTSTEKAGAMWSGTTGTGYQPTEAAKIEANVRDNLPKTLDKQVKDDTTMMQSNYEAIHGVQSILSGELPKADKDVIANAKTWAYSILGKENEQALANVDFNTKTGMAVATLIHAMSGASYTDNDRRNYLNILTAGNLADETYVKQAMTSFVGYLKERQTVVAERNMNLLPKTVGDNAPWVVNVANLKAAYPQLQGQDVRETGDGQFSIYKDGKKVQDITFKKRGQQ